MLDTEAGGELTLKRNSESIQKLVQVAMTTQRLLDLSPPDFGDFP
jgi:hypothetical protein